jgi:hypothetical protein
LSNVVPIDPERAAIQSEPRPTSAIARAWKRLDVAMLTERPPTRRWLLRHPTSDGKPCAPGEGDGMLPLGKVGLLIADGGIGKTRALLELGVSIVTGRPWFGHFHVGHSAREGRVLLALAEEDWEEVWRRLFDLAVAYKLTSEECTKIVDRIIVLPLAGQSVSLLSYDQEERAYVASAELRALRQKLVEEAGQGWSLVALDPLSRWGVAETETDNAVATRTVQAAESLLDVKGGPTVLFAHHASADGLRTDKAGQKNLQGRGVTGIRNAARWQSYLREEHADVYFRQNKSNYSRGMLDELWLVRLSGGLLRAITEGEIEERKQRTVERRAERETAKDATKDAATEAKIVAAAKVLLNELGKVQGRIASRADLVRLIRGDNGIKEAAASRLLANGQVIKLRDKEGLRFAVAALVNDAARQAEVDDTLNRG